MAQSFSRSPFAVVLLFIGLVVASVATAGAETGSEGGAFEAATDSKPSEPPILNFGGLDGYYRVLAGEIGIAGVRCVRKCCCWPAIYVSSVVNLTDFGFDCRRVDLTSHALWWCDLYRRYICLPFVAANDVDVDSGNPLTERIRDVFYEIAVSCFAVNLQSVRRDRGARLFSLAHLAFHLVTVMLRCLRSKAPPTRMAAESYSPKFHFRWTLVSGTKSISPNSWSCKRNG